MEDREVLLLCRQGNNDTYAVLVERYQRLVYSIAFHLLRNREEAEDAAQDAFIKVYRRIGSNPDLEFLPYIRTTVTNICLDRLRRNKTAARYLATTSEYEVTEHSTPESELMLTVDQRLLQQAVGCLPSMYREVIVLHYAAGHSYEAIAQMLDQPMSIVKNRIFRGKKILREIIAQQEGGISN